MKAKIVIGLGFGDEGKGITTDYLVSKSHDPIVIRFSGGQQAGHTVMVDGKKHISASYGAGSLRGIPTYISEHCTFYLNAIKNERLQLEEKMKDVPKLYIHPLAKVTTPYDVAWNQWIEQKIKHGSCGMGVGATMTRDKQGYKLYAVDLLNKAVAKEKLKSIKEKYERQAAVSEEDRAEFLDLCRSREDYFFSLLDEDLYEIKDYSILGRYSDLIFEGSQGIMLDMDHGIFPNVTYANTTSKNAAQICDTLSIQQRSLYYVTRCYQTRHGNGWMSSVGPIQLINNQEEINVTNKWQGDFRVSEIDYDLLHHAINVDSVYCGDTVLKHLVITCMDQRPDFQFDKHALKTNFYKIYESHGPDSQHFRVNKDQLLEF